MEDSDKLHALIFVSSATEILSEESTRYIIESERENAKHKGLTGSVIFASGSVMRLMEGNKNVVIKEFEFAKENYLHNNIFKITDQPIDQRYFEDFPLSYLPLNHPAYHSLNDFNDPVMKQFLEECLKLDSVLMKILGKFIQNNQ
ncbi:MAG: hypothetical protein JWQ25_1626 [Daejeonella sp.]|nr:hypothetical protein [Daejeonella sp.]